MILNINEVEYFEYQCSLKLNDSDIWNNYLTQDPYAKQCEGRGSQSQLFCTIFVHCHCDELRVSGLCSIAGQANIYQLQNALWVYCFRIQVPGPIPPCVILFPNVSWSKQGIWSSRHFWKSGTQIAVEGLMIIAQSGQFTILCHGLDNGKCLFFWQMMAMLVPRHISAIIGTTRWMQLESS